MAYSAMAVANAFIRRAQEGRVRGLTQLKLVMLMFFTQSWHLKRHNVAFMDDAFCRWGNGPAIPSIYHEFKHYGPSSITEFFKYVRFDHGDPCLLLTPRIPDTDVDQWEFVDEVLRAYGKLNGAELAYLARQPGTAWSEGPPDGGPICNKLLAERVESCREA